MTKTILFGATGMVGEGVLLECLANDKVEAVLAVGRRPSGIAHPKLQDLVLDDLFDIAGAESRLVGYDACFFCLGISSLGVSAPEYERVTHDLTLEVAKVLLKLEPKTTFCYVTGAGTDSTEKGRVAWARVKGATENTLLRMFERAVMFRPAFMKATEGQRRVNRYYRYLAWVYPIGRALLPAHFCTLQEVGRAMVNAAVLGSAKRVLEVQDIVELAAR